MNPSPTDIEKKEIPAPAPKPRDCDGSKQLVPYPGWLRIAERIAARSR